MCLVSLAYRVSKSYPLILAANRDERHARPSAAASWWSDEPTVLGGRDLSAGGTWLAVDSSGRLGAVTNFLESRPALAEESRGSLVTDYLRGSQSVDTFTAGLANRTTDYGPFNLLLFDNDTLQYASNRAPSATLTDGVHSISNGPRDSVWPKLNTASRGVEAALTLDDPQAALFALFTDAASRTAVGTNHQDALFIMGPDYGTRCCTVLLIDREGHVSFAERRFDSHGNLCGQSSYSFEITQQQPSLHSDPRLSNDRAMR